MPSADELKRRMDNAYNAAQPHSNDPDLTKYNQLMGDYHEAKSIYVAACNDPDS